MRDKIELLVVEELMRTEKKSGDFNSHHEAYAVTLEELEEMLDEVNHAAKTMDIIWQQVKSNSVDRFSLAVMQCDLIRALEEGVQVAAMMAKWIEQMDKKTDHI